MCKVVDELFLVLVMKAFVYTSTSVHKSVIVSHSNVLNDTHPCSHS